MPKAVDTPTQKDLGKMCGNAQLSFKLPERDCLHILLVLENVDRHRTRQTVVVVRFISDDI